jgi:hypothetical protein
MDGETLIESGRRTVAHFEASTKLQIALAGCRSELSEAFLQINISNESKSSGEESEGTDS